MHMNKRLQEKLKELPREPGVYFHKNADGEVIYVGKAAVLKNRVRQYFQKTVKDPKTEALVSEIADTDWIVVETEMDALFLENEMIKRYKPKWNILLRDDKNVSYVRINMKSEVPYVSTTRQPIDDGAKYIGPFYAKNTIIEALRILRHIFPFYDRPYTGKKTLYTDLGLTPGIEVGRMTAKEYKASLRRLIRYLEGDASEVSGISDASGTDSKHKRIEDKHKQNENKHERIENEHKRNKNEHEQINFKRKRKTQREKLIEETKKEMEAAAKAQDFERAARLRNEYFGLRGLKKKIVFSNKEFLDISSDLALTQLQKMLRLPEPPRRIEGFDISHNQGQDVVASMVVFVNGASDRSEYRKFKMRTQRNDDFKNMHETLSRRLKHSEWGRPDLFLIDGGQPQLEALRDLLEKSGVPYIGIAKGVDRIVLPPKMTGEEEYKTVVLPANSHVIKLLERIRDESHRFAITYHRSLQRKRLTR